MGDGLAEPNKSGSGVTALVACLVLAAFAVCVAPAGPLGARAEGTNNQGSGNQGGVPAAAPAQPAPQPPPGAAPPPQAAAPSPQAAAPTVPPQPQAVDRPGFLHQLKGWWDDSLTLFDRKSFDAKTDGKSFDTKSFDADSKDAHNAGGEANQKPDDGNAAAGAAQSAAAATQGAMKSAVEVTKGAASTATDAMKGAMEATKNAATVIVRLPNTRVVELHETCVRAPNGGADCAAAAANGCRAKGFAGGTPLDTRTGAACDTKQPDARQLQAGQTPAVRCAVEAVVTRAVCQ
jgi:hypothetical protein